MHGGPRFAVHCISVHRPGQPHERRPVTAPIRAGGSRGDDLHLPGSSPSSLRLVPLPAGIVVEAAAHGIRVGGRPLHPGGRRLLRPGERAELHGTEIVLDPAPAADGVGTRVAAGALLRQAAAGQTPISGAHLVVLSGAEAGTRHLLRAEQTLGRGRAASILLPDPRASRVHARIRVGAAGACVEDLASKNGVRVNGVRIDPRPCMLRPGDEILIGETELAVEDLRAGQAGADDPSAPGGGFRRDRLPRHVVAAALLALSAAALALAAG